MMMLKRLRILLKDPLFCIMNEIADDINAKIAENVSKSVSYTKRKIAKKMKALKEPVEKIAEITGLSEDEVNAL